MYLRGLTLARAFWKHCEQIFSMRKCSGALATAHAASATRGKRSPSTGTRRSKRPAALKSVFSMPEARTLDVKERCRIFGFCSAASQIARHRPFFRFFSRAPAASGPGFPKGLRKQPLGFSFLRRNDMPQRISQRTCRNNMPLPACVEYADTGARRRGCCHCRPPLTSRAEAGTENSALGHAAQSALGRTVHSSAGQCGTPMKNIAAVPIQCETGQEEKHA